MTPAQLTCQDVIGLLLDYLERTLGPATLASLERHLADCAACVAYLRTYRKTRDLTREATKVTMSEELTARLRAFLLERLARGA